MIPMLDILTFVRVSSVRARSATSRCSVLSARTRPHAGNKFSTSRASAPGVTCRRSSPSRVTIFTHRPRWASTLSRPTVHRRTRIARRPLPDSGATKRAASTTTAALRTSARSSTTTPQIDRAGEARSDRVSEVTVVQHAFRLSEAPSAAVFPRRRACYIFAHDGPGQAKGDDGEARAAG